MKPDDASIQFESVLVTDALARGFFSLAKEERLLYVASNEDSSVGKLNAQDRQSILSLLVLFDKLIVHDFAPGSGMFRIPNLERDGIVEVVPVMEP